MAQDEIWYGAVSGGSTFGFFEKSEHGTHEKLYNFMSGSPAHTFFIFFEKYFYAQSVFRNRSIIGG